MSAAEKAVLEDRVAALEAEKAQMRGEIDGILTFFRVMADLGDERYAAAASSSGSSARPRHLRVVR